jgi:micrococcal nuclease
MDLAKRKKRIAKKQIKYLLLIGAAVVIGGGSMLTDVASSLKDFNFLESTGLDNLGITASDVKEAADNAASLKEEVQQAIEVEYSSLEYADTTQETTASASSFDSTAQISFEYDAVGTVVRVKDGDTYVLDIDGADTTIRLIGVDTPESVAPATYSKENTQEGKDISALVKERLTEGTVLYVEYDVSKSDKYGRTLAYLYFEDGTMIQKWLLENGYAQVMTVQPNSKYADEFAKIQHTAAVNKTGLWNGYFEE